VTVVVIVCVCLRVCVCVCVCVCMPLCWMHVCTGACRYVCAVKTRATPHGVLPRGGD